MKRKTIFHLAALCLIISLMLSSCEDMMGDFLNKAPGVDVTEDTIFSSKIYAEEILASAYRDNIYTGLPQWKYRDGFRDAIMACCDDEAENIASWYQCQAFNTATLNKTAIDPQSITASMPVGNGDGRRRYRWVGIRYANIILEKIDNVPDADQTYKNQVKGQAKFLRALSYFEMLKRYGGCPIINKRLVVFDDYKDIRRSTFEQTVEFIVNDCDEAASVLPDMWPAAETGKATKGAALMLKSKTLLYAASPLFNTNDPVFPGYAYPGLAGYGNYDPSRWQRAATAAKAVLDWAAGAGIHLITDKGVSENYKYVWSVSDNAEVIMESKLFGGQAYDSQAFKSLLNFYNNQAGTAVTQNFVEKYEDTNGNKVVWPENGGNNLNQMYAKLDPRFHQTIAYNGSYFNKDFPVLKLYEGGVPAGSAPYYNCITGYWLHKLIPYEIQAVPRIPVYQVWHLFRLAEAYLNYAEAIVEYAGPTSEAYEAVRAIRERSGMPAFPSGLSKEEFREKLRNERTIELAFEDHRLWDIYRWRIAENEGVMQGAMRGIKITKNPDNDDYSWKVYTFETRSFNKNMYLTPFMDTEVNKGYLVQNPGWE